MISNNENLTSLPVFHGQAELRWCSRAGLQTFHTHRLKVLQERYWSLLQALPQHGHLHMYPEHEAY